MIQIFYFSVGSLYTFGLYQFVKSNPPKTSPLWTNILSLVGTLIYLWAAGFGIVSGLSSMEKFNAKPTFSQDGKKL